MVLLSLSLLSTLVLSYLTLPSLILFVWGFYLLTLSYSFNSPMFTSLVVYDENSLYLTYMLFFVILISYIYAYTLLPSTQLYFTFFIMLYFCYFMFSTTSLFYLYLSYEASLLPILYIIVKWGSYPERSLSAMMLLIYTSVFTFPFMYILFYWFSSHGSFMIMTFPYSFSGLSLVFTVLAFMTFAVKLPLYGLHFWLPMAHVEAPTFGSMILAGILLKLGGVGLLRISPILSLSLLSTLVLSYLMFGLAFVTLICCFQSDLKRLVAYSSVSHMMSIPILLLSNYTLAFKGATMLMFFHGLSSPLLFMCVGAIYSMYSTRQLILIRGMVLISPLFTLILILSFVFTMSTPPFPSYLSEILFIVFSYSLTPYMIIPLLLFTFFSLVYNLNWLSSLVFFSPSPSISSVSQLTYSLFSPMIFSLVLCFPFLIFVSSF